MSTEDKDSAPTTGDALDRVSEAHQKGVTPEYILGWITSLDPALVIRAVEEILANRGAGQ